MTADEAREMVRAVYKDVWLGGLTFSETRKVFSGPTNKPRDCKELGVGRSEDAAWIDAASKLPTPIPTPASEPSTEPLCEHCGEPLDASKSDWVNKHGPNECYDPKYATPLTEESRGLDVNEYAEPMKITGKHRFMAGTCVDCGRPLAEVCIPTPSTEESGEPTRTMNQGRCVHCGQFRAMHNSWTLCGDGSGLTYENPTPASESADYLRGKLDESGDQPLCKNCLYSKREHDGSRWCTAETRHRCSFYQPIEDTEKSAPASGASLIQEERQRQTDVEGWTPEHDDHHSLGQLALAAKTYILLAQDIICGRARAVYPGWPWDYSWWKPSPDPIRNLVKAGALIAAEIDRLKRGNS